jgi:hypothetical protein
MNNENKPASVRIVLSPEQEEEREAITAFCKTLDTPAILTAPAKELLDKLNVEFPLDPSDKRRHTITLTPDGHLALGICGANAFWTITFHFDKPQ